jgi:hypothetical protein
VSDSIPTARLRATTLGVVVVHDDVRACRSLVDALRAEFIVRSARSAQEMTEQLGPIDRLTCVVGVLGETIRARDIHAAFIAVGGKPGRLVFVTTQELSQPSSVRSTVDVVRSLGQRRFY